MEKIKNDVLNLKNRKKIFDFIFNYPGLHLRKIIKEIKLSEGTIKYHIEYLLKHELIFKHKKEGYTRFYVNNPDNIKAKKIISYLRNDIARPILLFYCSFVCGSLKKICENIETDKKQVSKYIKKLIEDDIIEIAPLEGSEVITNFKRCKKRIYNPSNGEKIYRLKKPYELNDVIISLKNRYFDDGVTEEVLEILNFFYMEKNNRPKKIRSDEESVDGIIEVLFKLFPLPFCA